MRDGTTTLGGRDGTGATGSVPADGFTEGAAENQGDHGRDLGLRWSILGALVALFFVSVFAEPVQSQTTQPDPIVISGDTELPIVRAGTATGSVDAARHGVTSSGPCTGSIGAVPDHVLRVGSERRLRVEVRSEDDTTLVILGPGGPRCNDDQDGLNPAIEAVFPRGDHRVFVGTFSGRPAPYRLRLAPGSSP